jgi:ribonuclease D
MRRNPGLLVQPTVAGREYSGNFGERISIDRKISIFAVIEDEIVTGVIDTSCWVQTLSVPHREKWNCLRESIVVGGLIPAGPKYGIRLIVHSVKEDVMAVIKNDLLESDVERLRKSRIVGIDTETGGLIPNRDRLYLMQICDNDGVIDIIQTDHWENARNLRMVLMDPAIQKVIQFAVMDCAFILTYLGLLPANVYCTKIASKIARTYSSSHSLSALISDLVGITLDKKQQTTFWGKTQLTPEQIEYASNDVKYLIGVHTQLENILAQKGLLPTGISYTDLNKACQSCIPTLVHIWMNGWDFGKEDPQLIFGR